MESIQTTKLSLAASLPLLKPAFKVIAETITTTLRGPSPRKADARVTSCNPVHRDLKRIISTTRINGLGGSDVFPAAETAA